MPARVKLLTLWGGPLPAWWPQFAARLVANARTVDHELVTLPAAEVNALATDRLGFPVRKRDHYALCDLRPFLRRVFPEKFEGYEWWGWADLDVVLGDLDRLLPPLLDAHDVVTTDGLSVSGPLTVLRNTPHDLVWGEGLVEGVVDVMWSLAEPDYCNLDETGFADAAAVRAGAWNGNPSLSRALASSGLRVRYDGRFWTESHDPLEEDAGPSRTAVLAGRRLSEYPTRRELLGYHFNASKRWPSLGWPDHRAMRLMRIRAEQRRQDAKSPPAPFAPEPVDDPAYWDARAELARAEGWQVHRLAYDAELEHWDRIRAHTRRVLWDEVPSGARVLDAGCGFGQLSRDIGSDCDGPSPTGDRYVGVDFNPKMVTFAKGRYPSAEFHVADVRRLPYQDDSFDWAVCRGLEGSYRTRVSNREWARVRTELLRVAPRLLLIDYSGGSRVCRREDYSC